MKTAKLGDTIIFEMNGTEMAALVTAAVGPALTITVFPPDAPHFGYSTAFYGFGPFHWHFPGEQAA